MKVFWNLRHGSLCERHTRTDG